jgi:hypothetical protein
MIKTLLALLKSDQLELKPGPNVVFGKTVKLTVRVWREKEQRWYEVLT